MAWLQNLAGRAEDLLNKIDQNAATVLNEPNQNFDENGEVQLSIAEEAPSEVTASFVDIPDDCDSARIASTPSPATSITMDVVKSVEASEDNVSLKVESVLSSNESVSIKDERPLRSNLSSTSSMRNSFILAEETQILNEKIAKLVFENQDLNKQLLNMQHLYLQLRNDNGNMQFQIERLNEQVLSAQSEKDQYIARAQRILQEKEKLISLKQENATVEETENVYAVYNEELKRELEFQQRKNEELSDKNKKLSTDIQSLQMQHQIIQNGLNQTNQSLENNLLNEKRLKTSAEEECQQKIQELYMKSHEIQQLQEIINSRNEENLQLKELFKQKTNLSTNPNSESRIQDLTQTLMLKQNHLETVTTERNALRLQMEKLDTEYKKNILQLQRSQVKVVNVTESNNTRSHVPQFMRVSPLDAGVTRRVKHAYSTVDAISVRTGTFLRRYPFARVLVFCYMVLLHIWVLVILLLYAPSNR